MRTLIVNTCFVWIVLAGSASFSFAQNTCSTRCPNGSMSEVYRCDDENYVPACYRSTAPTAPAAPAGATLQQRMVLSGAQAAMPYLQQAVHDFFYGSPVKQPVVDPAEQQRTLAAQQLNNSGIYLFKQKKYAGAVNEFQQALVQTPNDANIINNLALAKQQLGVQQLNVKAAAQTSGALGQLLGKDPADAGNLNFDQLTHSSIANPNASPVNLVDLDAGVAGLRGATRTSVDAESLKGQLDGILANHAPASAPPDPQVVPSQAQDIELLFQPQQSTSSQFPGPQRPADSPKPVNPMDAEQQTKAQIEGIFAQPGGFDGTSEKQALEVKAKPAPDPSLKDAVNDSQSDDQKAATRTGLFGTKSPSHPDLGGPLSEAAIATHSAAEQGSSAANSGKDAAAVVSIERTKALANCQWDQKACIAPDISNTLRPPNQQTSKPVPAAVANSEAYKDLQRQQEELKKKHQELDTRLTEIRQKQASGQGDQGALAIEGADIKNQQTAVRSAEGDVDRKMNSYIVDFPAETPPDNKPVPPISTPPSLESTSPPPQ